MSTFPFFVRDGVYTLSESFLHVANPIRKPCKPYSEAMQTLFGKCANLIGEKSKPYT